MMDAGDERIGLKSSIYEQKFAPLPNTRRHAGADSLAEHADFRGRVAGRNKPAAESGGRCEAAGDRRVQLLHKSKEATPKMVFTNSLKRGKN
jgi:hypothetical protein